MINLVAKNYARSVCYLLSAVVQRKHELSCIFYILEISTVQLMNSEKTPGTFDFERRQVIILISELA